MKLSFEVWPNDPYSGMGVTGVPMNSWADLPVKDCIDKVSKYEYEGVDFIHEFFLKMEDGELEETRNTIGDYTKDKGLEINSIGAHHLVLTDREWEMRGQVELIKNAIDLADDIGANTVASYVAGYYSPPTYKLITREEAINTLVEYARELCDYAGERRLTFSLETHQETLIDKPNITMQIVEKIDRDNLKLTVDFGGLELGVKPIMPNLEQF